jgi:hypothetical protein
LESTGCRKIGPCVEHLLLIYALLPDLPTPNRLRRSNGAGSTAEFRPPGKTSDKNLTNFA